MEVKSKMNRTLANVQESAKNDYDRQCRASELNERGEH